MQDIIQLRTEYINVCHWKFNGQFLLFARVFPHFTKEYFLTNVYCPFQNIEDDSKIQTTQLAKTIQKTETLTL